MHFLVRLGRLAVLVLVVAQAGGTGQLVDGREQAVDVLEVLGDVTDSDREAAYELGGTLAALALEQPERQ